MAEKAIYDTRTLKCQRFRTDIEAGSLLMISAEFIMNIPSHAGAEKISEALKNVGLYFAGGNINIIKADGKPRCFYCGCKAELADKTCSQCGAPL